MKEAIKRLRSIGEKGMRESDYREVSDSLALYRQDLELVLYTPTSDEVCRLIEKDVKGKARYSHGQFYIDDDMVGDLLLDKLRPRTLIAYGNFYESLEEQK